MSREVVRLRRKVNIKPIKETAKKMPEDHPLQSILEVEDSETDAEEFVAHQAPWQEVVGILRSKKIGESSISLVVEVYQRLRLEIPTSNHMVALARSIQVGDHISVLRTDSEFLVRRP